METERMVGVYDRGQPGPCVIVTAGLHGNEPAGVLAQRRVLDTLATDRPTFRGRLTCLAGNLPALKEGLRFLDRDLNRGWDDASCASALTSPDSVEANQQAELLATFDKVLAAATGPAVFIDLHTAGRRRSTFCVSVDVTRNRHLALATPLPVVLRLDEAVNGSMQSWLARRGHITTGFEGGQHEEPGAVANLEAIIWLCLARVGATVARDIVSHHRHLARVAEGCPNLLEMVHRHPVHEGDGFTMEPGYINFSRVVSGQRIAADRSGPIRAPADGFLLLPRYDGTGSDGFFLCRPLSRWRLGVRDVWRRLSRTHERPSGG